MYAWGRAERQITGDPTASVRKGPGTCLPFLSHRGFWIDSIISRPVFGLRLCGQQPRCGAPRLPTLGWKGKPGARRAGAHIMGPC